MSDKGVAPGWYPTREGQRYWDGEAWTDHIAPAPVQTVVAVPEPYRTNHVLHLLLTFLTFGAWGVVWAFVAWQNASKRNAMRGYLAATARRGTPESP